MKETVETHKFCGPVFIIGMPRSGTKLMRALMNQHPNISITPAESHFIPYFIKKYGNPPSFNKNNINQFLDAFSQTSFYRTMKRAGYELNREEFANTVSYSSWSSIFEYLFRNFGSKKLLRSSTGIIWGDKTPGYINHIPLLKSLFPKSKFIHMVRDPRDYCLSVRRSWGKSIYRAAHRWTETVGKARNDGSDINEDYIEVYYELLLENPEKTMREVCNFLSCLYDEKMVKISSSHEDVGDAKGRYGIVRDNTKKYLTHLSESEVKRIEEIVYSSAISLNYALDHKAVPRKLSHLHLALFKLYDGYASLKYHVSKEHKLSKGIKYYINHYAKSSWR
jgi:hypothetical protein